ncbi:(R)-1-hydroxy-2-aminoethylphosphonate ammonia-lyase [Reichenbachiella agariperforans]|uniref:(R)-1-hydroxy-2-aminoethylphosphonate ammonia-lyase n=1 Tax=Reichenbachiella agariperforans TaxID=156994 RepID=UPI001C0A42BF|nr:aspartate aminotransferase family protein [Reichenbachiella agariperforans]MBU2912927.1 aspartate aminotransferase family protein [Reichenbachiella agariperforans]
MSNMTASFVQQGDTHKSGVQSRKAESLSQASRTILNRDANIFLHQALSSPVMNVIERAEGAYIFDHDGKRYFDLHGNGVHHIGYNNPAVVAAIKRQLDDQLSFAPRRYTAQVTVDFAEKLVSMAPEELDRVLFCPGGSEAIEMAVMLAKRVTGKWKTVSFWNQFHGSTFQAATLSGNAHWTTGVGPMVPGAFFVEFPNYYRNPWGIDPADTDAIDDAYLDQLRVVFQNNPDIAAVVGTPVASTPFIPTARYWQTVRTLCDEYGAFLIFDEIVCGMGRTGKMFAAEHYVTPDVLVVGKSLGGGILPFAGILTKGKYNVVADYSIGHFTHEKSPISAAAGHATIDFIRQEELVSRAESLGSYLLKGLQEMAAAYDQIGHVDGIGLLLSIDLVTSKKSKERNPTLANAVLEYGLSKGLSFKVIDTNVVTLHPPLIISQDEADFILESFRQIFKSLIKN